MNTDERLNEMGMNLVKFPKEKALEKAFGYSSKKELSKACTSNKRLGTLVGVGAALELLGTKSFFSVIAFMEITLGRSDLRYGQTLLDYLDKSLKTEELLELSMMLISLQEITKGLKR